MEKNYLKKSPIYLFVLFWRPGPVLHLLWLEAKRHRLETWTPIYIVFSITLTPVWGRGRGSFWGRFVENLSPWFLWGSRLLPTSRSKYRSSTTITQSFTYWIKMPWMGMYDICKQAYPSKSVTKSNRREPYFFSNYFFVLRISPQLFKIVQLATSSVLFNQKLA